MFPRTLLSLVCAAVLATTTQADAQHQRLTNLPHVYINTFTGNDIYSKTEYVFARMWYVDETDQVEYYDSLAIRGRGNSTWSLAKKPYKLSFHEKVKLLGKGYAKTKKWTMLANHADKTMLRNALTSIMGERAGLKFNPAAKFVDLTLNDRYVGTYQISDQVDVRPHRVNVTEQDYPLTQQSDISGGYLLEADGFKDFTQGHNGFYSSNYGVPLRIHYPDEDEIDPTQFYYISNFITEFENRLQGNDFTHPTLGYRIMVDSTSLANWYICTEISANVDGFFSCYMYKERDDNSIYFGPLWDYDIAYNNDNRYRGNSDNTERQLMCEVGYGGSWGGGNRMWVQRMWEDPWFARLVNRQYNALVNDGLETYLNAKLDSLTSLINASQQLNYQRWSINTRTMRERVLHSTYDEYVTDVRTFLRRHIAYLTQAFADRLPDSPDPQNPEVKQPDFVTDGCTFYSFTNAGTGTAVDIDTQTDEVCCRRSDHTSRTQHWLVRNLQNGFLFITNRATGQALHDPSPAGATATTQTGSTINVVAPDSTVAEQQWDLVLQSNGLYNLISRSSQHAANLSGGNAADGTPVLSYTSIVQSSVGSCTARLVHCRYDLRHHRLCSGLRPRSTQAALRCRAARTAYLRRRHL